MANSPANPPRVNTGTPHRAGTTPVPWAIGSGKAPATSGAQPLRRAMAAVLTVVVFWGAAPGHAAGPFPDQVIDVAVGPLGGFNMERLPEIVLGGPRGRGLFNGSADVFSLGQGGTITLAFTESVIVDGPGADFTVFENAFLTAAGTDTGPPFAEPARVFVSIDGTEFFEFPCALDDSANLHPGCAGVFPVFANVDDAAAPPPTVPTTVPISSLLGVALPAEPPPGSGGDSFDLASLGIPGARFIRIVSGPGRFPAAEGKGGFDLDAIAAVHWQPAADTDGDGSDDAFDNCRVIVNPDQADRDNDGIGDACDRCPDLADSAAGHPGDGPEAGGDCDPDGPASFDTDGDGVPDHADNCPAVHNAAQEDRDVDGIGDACDLCATIEDAANVDTDGDAIGDACDPCPNDEACGPLQAATYAGGRRNHETERFLTFAAPAGKLTTVAADALTAELRVNFAPSIDPLTLRVKIRGADVTALFTPVVPGTSKRVVIPLTRRRTKLRLQIKGTKRSGARARDVDRLVFRRKRQ